MLSARRLRLGMTRRTRGLSLVELMVGTTVGLFVVGGAAMLVASQLGDNRRLLLETQVQQDLRAAADLITRDLRRAAYWGSAAAGTYHGAPEPPRANPYAAMVPAGASAAAVSVGFAYSRGVENEAVDGTDLAGYRLNGGVIEMLMGAGGWQALTDANTLRVTTLRFNVEDTPLPLTCALPCPAAGPGAVCPPVQHVRTIGLLIGGQAAHDARVQRSVRSTVRLRNDIVEGNCPA